MRRMTDDHVTCRARLAQVSLNSPCVSFLLPFSSAGVGRETGPGGVNCHALQYYSTGHQKSTKLLVPEPDFFRENGHQRCDQRA